MKKPLPALDEVLDIDLGSVAPPDRTGPRGGDLNRHMNPQYRDAEFQPKDGGLGLHRQEYRPHAIPGLKNEQPWHRMAAYMLLAGRSNVEISKAADVTPAQVTFLRAQRWFQELIATLANDTGQDILGVVRGEALASVQTLVEIRNDDNAPSSVRRAAAKDLLEFAVGKAVQRTINENHNRSYDDPAVEHASLLAELQSLEQRRVAQTLPLPPCDNQP